MAKYRVTMTREGATDSVTIYIYIEKANSKVAYDDAVARATLIFGAPISDKFHVVNVVEVEV